jgi:hypothetical protein
MAVSKENMNKNPLILYISLFPILILVLLAGSAGYFLLKDEIKIPNFKKEPEVRRLEGFPTVIYVDQEIEKQRRVIRSQEELQEFLRTVDPSGNLVLGEKINFNKEYLLGVSSTQELVDTEMRVRKLYEDKKDESLLVVIRRSVLADTCEKDEQKNVAVDLVAVTKTDHKIDFDIVKETAKKCFQ